MKKLLATAALFSVGSLFAQQNINGIDELISLPQPQQTAIVKKSLYSSADAQQQSLLSDGKFRGVNPETVVGGTTFDLQTNGSNQKRIVNQGDGTLSLCWMLSYLDNSKNPTDRGSGYNYFNGNSWIYSPDNILNRLESKRTGWPNILTTQSGKEIIISHGSIDTSLVMLSRNTKGSGAWTQKNLFPGQHLIWCRAVVGGANGNTIHLIAVTPSAKENGPKYNGMDGALLYSKSTDGGNSWSALAQVQGVDSNFSIGLSGDCYSIDASGDNVAIVVGDSWSDVLLAKSTNNGDAWTNTTIFTFPYPHFDEKTTLTPDTPYTADGFTEILLDLNGTAHVWYGNMRVRNEKINNDSLSLFVGTNGLIHWKEGDVKPSIIAQAIDLDGDQLITTAKDQGYEFPIYNCGLSSMASAGIDADGVIYVVYSAFVEGFYSSPGMQNYRHLYAIKSFDNGNTWTYPNDITPSTDDRYREYVYPSLARLVDNNLHIIAQEDNEPGLAISSENDPFNVNNLEYLKVTTALDIAVKEVLSPQNKVDLYPNPSSASKVQITLHLNEGNEVKLSICDVLGKNIDTQYCGFKAAGLQQIEVNTSTLKAGVYFVTLSAGSINSTKQMVIQ